MPVFALCSSSPLRQQPARIDDAALAKAGRTGDDWLTWNQPGRDPLQPAHRDQHDEREGLNLAWSYDVGSGGGGQRQRRSCERQYTASQLEHVFAVDANGQGEVALGSAGQPGAVRPEICRRRERGLAIYNGMVFAPVIDGRLRLSMPTPANQCGARVVLRITHGHMAPVSRRAR